MPARHAYEEEDALIGRRWQDLFLEIRAERSQIGDVSRFLANLAMYPFHTGEPLDWWHTLSPDEVPLFSITKCLLLHPRFVNEGWDSIAIEEGDVHLLNVVPITKEEKDLRSISAILDKLREVDIFEPR